MALTLDRRLRVLEQWKRSERLTFTVQFVGVDGVQAVQSLSSGDTSWHKAADETDGGDRVTALLPANEERSGLQVVKSL